MQSIVTGQLLVALDLYPDKEATLVGLDRETLEIPTIPTPLQELTKRFEKIPIEDIVDKINASLTGIEKIINSPEVGGSIAKLNATMGGIEKIVNSPETTELIRSVKQSVDDARVLIKNIDGQVGPIAGQLKAVGTRVEKLADTLDARIEPLVSSITRTSDEARVALKKAEGTMGTVDEFAGESSILMYRLEKNARGTQRDHPVFTAPDRYFATPARGGHLREEKHEGGSEMENSIVSATIKVGVGYACCCSSGARAAHPRITTS